MRRGLREVGVDVAADDGLLSVDVDPDRFRQVSEVMDDTLTSEEARSTRAVLVDADTDPSPARLLRAYSWPELRARHEDRWLFEMLDEDRLDVHFQPIVRADDPDRTVGYEALLRGQDANGEVVPPGRLFRRAREAGLLFTLDRESRMAAVRAAGEWIGDERVFVNFNPASIYDPEYCLRTTVQAVGDAELRADQFVFEVVETEEVDRVDDLVDILDYYRDAGFSV
ncbi:MAG: EAL domain-containing protein, partial [Gemmatimonadota bacterium]